MLQPFDMVYMNDLSAQRAVWKSMKQRCTNPNSKDYAYYGGRGIEVCARWLESFDNFVADMGIRPTGTMLDRIDNDGNYTGDNCRWTTRREQMLNKRSNRILVINGISKPMKLWSEQTGLDYNLIQTRIARGWEHKKAVTTPPLLCGRWHLKPKNENC